MRILLIRALDENHLYSVFTRSLCNALLAHGAHAEMFDFPSDPGTFISRLATQNYDAVISFGSFQGGFKFEDGLSIFDCVGVKFLGWQFDHPIYVSHNISNPMAGRRSIYPNGNHVRFVEAAGLAGKNMVLLPGADPHDIPIKDYTDRSMDIFVAATWNGEPVRIWESLQDGVYKRVLVQVIERLLISREVSLIDSFQGACEDLGYADLKLDEDVFALLRAALNYVRHVDRLNAILGLANAGFPLTICGSGWEQAMVDRRNVQLLPSVPFSQARHFYGDAKLSLNLNAGNGGCERAIHAMLAGSCVVSDFSGALSQPFSDQEICFFDRNGVNAIGNVVGELLEGPRAEAMANRGWAKAESSMLWTHRIESILSLLQ